MILSIIVVLSLYMESARVMRKRTARRLRDSDPRSKNVKKTKLNKDEKMERQLLVKLKYLLFYSTSIGKETVVCWEGTQ